MIIENARRQETIARLKKFYSAISQASIKAKAFGNDWEIWVESATNDPAYGNAEFIENFAKQYILPYLNYMKTEKNNGEYYIYLNDGSYFYPRKGGCMELHVDINGKKKPNENGKDIFVFLFCANDSSYWAPATGKVIPCYTKSENSRQKILEECKSNNRNFCSALIMMDGWEFKDDYPHKI